MSKLNIIMATDINYVILTLVTLYSIREYINFLFKFETEIRNFPYEEKNRSVRGVTASP